MKRIKSLVFMIKLYFDERLTEDVFYTCLVIGNNIGKKAKLHYFGLIENKYKYMGRGLTLDLEYHDITLEQYRRKLIMRMIRDIILMRVNI